jgi:phenylacetate-coenzyme A ligase PaaK-like adenylate-forming protein
VAVRDLVPTGYGRVTPTTYESGGTTGAPKRVVFLPDWMEQLMGWLVADLDEPAVRERALLMVGPTGPHLFGQLQREVAARLNSVLFNVDLDPRWVKKLLARDAAHEAAAYVEHIVEQARLILRTQDIAIVVSTPPLLEAIARQDDLVELINAKVARIQAAGAHLDQDTRDVLRDIFPNVKLTNMYGSTMILGASHTRDALSVDDPTIHDAFSPYITFSVIDPETGQRVGYGERGRVVMNHISKAMFLPNNLERDTAIRVAGLQGQVGDSVSEVKPVETFHGETVVEGVY